MTKTAEHHVSPSSIGVDNQMQPSLQSDIDASLTQVEENEFLSPVKQVIAVLFGSDRTVGREKGKKAKAKRGRVVRGGKEVRTTKRLQAQAVIFSDEARGPVIEKYSSTGYGLGRDPIDAISKPLSRRIADFARSITLFGDDEDGTFPTGFRNDVNNRRKQKGGLSRRHESAHVASRRR